MENMFNNLSSKEQIKLNELLDKLRNNGEA
jgi:hypothetical protein